MDQGLGPAAVPRSAGSAGAQAISRRIHRADRGRLSAAAGRQGAAAVSAAVYRGGEVADEGHRRRRGLEFWPLAFPARDRSREKGIAPLYHRDTLFEVAHIS